MYKRQTQNHQHPHSDLSGFMRPLHQHPEEPTRGAQNKQSVWPRISLDDSQDLLNIIPTFSRARQKNFCINISQPKTINILIPICLAIWGPFNSIPKGRLAAPKKDSLHGFESASMTARIF